ncbi:phosphoketolase family protein [Candidatus Saccharibacteria bacterium]|nr:phosphoketolase family protein [Candidatus Saccharibacteria bacterium]
MNEVGNLEKFRRATNYLTAAQIFLRDNFLLERPLTHDDIKPRLLGHWGSGPGVNLIYSHLNRLIKERGQEMLFVLGPGHAYPSLQANLFLEKSLQEFFPQATHTYDGISYLCRNFSWPYGFPSHSNPGTPGTILEGGELGYSLSTSYGAALDNPNLVVACLVGDGEAETGPMAGSWHINKLVDPRTNGTVLPILHLNGYKISQPTVFGRMSDDELKSLFWGYGYDPRIVNGEDIDTIDQQLIEALDWAHSRIWEIKKTEGELVAPHMPMIIMRTIKGWTGPKELNGHKIEGNCLSHQVVLMDAKTDPDQLKMLEDWLRSYRFNELFDRENGFGDFVDNLVPDGDMRMGMSKHARGGDAVYKPLELPDAEKYMEDAEIPGTIGSSSMIRTGLYLKDVMEINKDTRNFRFLSPDETYSNKLDAVYEATSRAWVWPHQDWDMDMSPDGRGMEMLSEHNLQGICQGYVLTGRHVVFSSYEAFLPIVGSMMDQYAKFLRHMDQYPWHGQFPSINYILTSSGWRQDHNGFSHQNPSLIDDALRRQGNFVNVYFPADGNTALVCIKDMLSSTQKINLLVAGKTLEPRWLNPELAKKQFNSSIMTWEFASDPNPDVVFGGIGDYPTKESLAAIDIIKKEYPDAKLRFVNISSLASGRHGHGIGRCGDFVSDQEFLSCFTDNKPVIINFHGYPETIKSILYNYEVDPKRFDIRGYIEHGSTTTPFDMHVRNLTSRYHMVIAAFEKMAAMNRVSQDDAQRIILKYQKLILANTEYIKENGVDMPEIDAWQWHVAEPSEEAVKANALSQSMTSDVSV